MRFVIGFCILLLPLLVNGQIYQAVRGGLSGDSSNYFSGNLTMSFSINNRSSSATDDVVFIGFENHADLTYFSTKHAYIVIGQVNYQKVSNGPFVSNGFGHWRANFGRKKTVSTEAFTQLQYDEGRMMSFRFLTGGGLRFRLKDKKKSEYFIGTGLMFEREVWDSTMEESEELTRNLPKSTNYFSAKVQFNDLTELDAIAYYQVGWDHITDEFRHRVNTDLLFTLKLSTKLSLRNSISLLYDARPIIPINNFVYSVLNGFTYSLN